MAASFTDLSFFILVIRQGSLSAAAREMGLTPPSVSKRLAALEARLGVRLLNRSTRRMSLTPEGETYFTEGARVVAQLDCLEQTVAGSRVRPRGLLKIAATLGFGRRFVAPALSKFHASHPDVEVQLHLTDQPVNLVERAFDAYIQIGEISDSRLTARTLAPNERVLCAAPSYLRRFGEPSNPQELRQHRCIFIREGDETFGAWSLQCGARQETIKVRGPMNTNDGESALSWALDGHGIVMRSQWDAARYLRSGRLRVLLADWKLPSADVRLVLPNKSNMPAKTRAFVDFMLDWFKAYRHTGNGPATTW